MNRVSLTLAATLIAAAAAVPFADAKTPPNLLVVAKNIDDIVSLDPAQAYEFTSGEVVANIYNKLVEYNPAQIETVVPGLAESWKISDDGKTITFKLKSGVKFASGNAVRPEDVVFSLRRVIVLKKAPAFILAQFGWTADNIDQMVNKVSDSEVSVSIAENFAPSFVLNALAARPGSIVDEKEAMKNAKDNDLGNAWLSRNSAGSGPFALRVWRPGESLVLDANKNHAGGAPKMNQIVFNHVAEASTQRLMVESGDADIARNLGPDQIAAVKDKAGIKVETYPQAALHFFSFNLKHDKLKNPALWEAMRYLIDYDGIANTLLRGQMKVHQTFWPSGFPGAVEDKPYKLDVAKAKDILAKANIQSLSVDMDMISSAPFTDIAQSMQATMAQAGIKVNLLPGTSAQVITKYRARQHEMMLLYWGPDFMDPHSNAKAFAYNVDNADGSPQSTTTWRNSWAPADLSARTRAALVERDAAKRLDMYRDLQRDVLKSSPWVMTFQAQAQVALRNEVKGFIHGPTNDLVLYRNVTK
ncbi:ABC transporter substrate-binding protein [Ferrovibrio terrae]|uniref:ABC transporter substrate-binding protein n=1 Tax=Ferrovibrio terrae TaxID=2594003 RepID=A0A516H0Q5_9PROT|nr:ABC transporter substrate-binding protein [Ferrovibrio terrae]QDO97363.1 ABC transporter substrate-binding protein [Ferrovibrio terrae]